MDEIGDALAIALEAIEEHSGAERYSKPELAARIQAVRAQMEELQLLLDESLPDDDTATRSRPALRVVAHSEAPDDGSALTPGRSDGPKPPTKRA